MTPEDLQVATLPNGVRVLTIHEPRLRTAAASVFVRSGSAHETRAENGLSHFIEHVVYKGSATRDARRINLDAERLGAEVNAHTDKDHTAFHLRGLGEHAAEFVHQLGDLVGAPTFPADEIERERGVLLHECTEDEEDPLSTAFKLFDKACFGSHGAAQPVIGPRRNIERFTRAQMVEWVRRRYTGANVVVAVIGGARDAVERAAEAAFGALPAGTPNEVPAAAYEGGIATKRDEGSSQAHAVLGFALPPMTADDPRGALAAAVLGEGMSSPLLDQLRERRGLAYHAHCAADVLAMCGQFVIEASTGPKQVEELLAATMQLLHAHAEHVDPQDLQRAQRQLAVRLLRDHERPARRLEDAALDLLMLGRVRPATETLARWQALGAADVRDTFAGLLASGASVALAGELPRAASERVRAIVGRPRPAAQKV